MQIVDREVRLLQQFEDPRPIARALGFDQEGLDFHVRIVAAAASARQP
jgi:hypothetical protein